MGLTTNSIHIRLEGRPREEALAAVEAAVRRTLEGRGLVAVERPEAAARAVFLVPGRDWISIFDTGFEQTETLAANLSRDAWSPAVSLQVVDSDRYRLKLFREGRCVADLHGGTGRSGAPAVARAWFDLMPPEAAAEDAAAALAGDEVFAERRAGNFAALLGIDREICLRPAADLWKELPSGALRLLYGVPAAATAEPPRFRLAVQPGPVRLSTGESLGALSVSAVNAGGASHGVRIRVSGDLVAAGALEIHEAAIIHFPEALRQDAPPQPARALLSRAADGALEAALPGLPVPGVPRTGSVAMVNAGWRAASILVSLAGRAAAPGAGTLSVVIAPLDDPAGVAEAEFPVEITAAPRMPLRAVAGQEKAARDLADPSVLIAMASLGEDRAASAAAVRAAMEEWLDVIPGQWVVTLQRDPYDFDLKPLRVESARRAKSKRWKEALEAVASCHLMYGTLDPDPRTGIGRAAFVLDASGQPASQAGGVSPQFCLWTEAAPAPPGAGAALRDVMGRLVTEARPFQAFLARWNWKTLSLGATPYETACGIGGASLQTTRWCSRYLRGAGEAVWLSRHLTLRLNRPDVEAVAAVREEPGGGWWVELRQPAGLDELEKALAPVLGGREEWLEAMGR